MILEPPHNFAFFRKALETKARKGDLQKLRIVEETIRLIDKEGVENLTFEKIGKALGISHSHVSYYFPEKELAVGAAISLVNASLQYSIEKACFKCSSKKEKLAAHIRGVFECLKANPSYGPVFTLSFYYCTRSENYRSLFRKIRNIGVERLSAYVGENVQGSGQELQKLSKNIQLLITGAAIEYLCDRSDKNYKKLLSTAVEEASKMAFPILSNKRKPTT